ncbi:ABC transporter permease subunit [Shewanella maritima]|uniref:ABC transporter permease subunit n=1 Tax=Shewanella maritima TaxID=2520507 RepID=A0A411PJM2_9GAMM|nr:ABC transporter permease subunit [Shewanella maritima]QBF83688.1 ABC transporter permease subunit [Shewanella maritima]
MMAERLQQICSAVVLILILALFGFLFWFALPVFINPNSSTFSLAWQPEQGQFGILSMLAASCLLGLVALIIALPVALGVCGFCQLEQYKKYSVWIRRLIRFMAGIPTVVYGIAAVFLLVPFIRETFNQGSGFSLLAASLMLVLLILPVMVMVLDAYCQPLTARLSQTAASMGFTSPQLLFHVTLPAAKPAICSAALLGFSRAIGDTLLPLMLAGNAPQLASSLFDSVRALTAHIGLVIATEHGSAEYNSLFAAGFLLLCINLFITLSVRKLGQSQQQGAGKKVRSDLALATTQVTNVNTSINTQSCSDNRQTT